MKPLIVLLISLSAYLNSEAQGRPVDSLKQLLQKETTDTGRVLLLAELAFRLHESKPETAMSFALEGLSLATQNHYEKGEAVCLNRVANVYSVLDQASKSMGILLKALKINERIHNYDGIQKNFNNLGILYRESGDYDIALDYFLKSKKLSQDIKSKTAGAVSVLNIGDTYFRMKKYDSASVFIMEAYNMAMRAGNVRTTGNALGYLAAINLAMKHAGIALEYCRLSIPYLLQAENFAGLSAVYLTTAKTYTELNATDSALTYAKMSLQAAQERAFISAALPAAEFLSNFYRKINADSAFFYQDIAKAAYDSLNSQSKQREFQSMAFEDKMRQQEEESKRIEEQQQRNLNLQYAAIALVLVSFLILFFAFSHTIIANQRVIRFLGVIALLIVFEFLNLLLHPWLGAVTHHSPVLMLLAMVCVAALLIPLHHRVEHWITHKLVEKNKKIRLSAAKRVVAELEPGATA
jgi:tetratricopeptide (TPR) repeat protein